eukprot:CAMPEP_0194326404 /NCGR_PEP_ID=MMETSP0171-20130528/36409_1 /TAXON_ID=218684 /ORGANISM="Corethron pennatum, Strain L29A3" /LENGTH=63 /DNA_ID=CAMNT_0039085969 /DNA_START=1114 /DNA_END=1302 /DNA_ORIENTATION=-
MRSSFSYAATSGQRPYAEGAVGGGAAEEESVGGARRRLRDVGAADAAIARAGRARFMPGGEIE